MWRKLATGLVFFTSATTSSDAQTQNPPWDAWQGPWFMWGGSSWWWICPLMMLLMMAAMMVACRLMGCGWHRD